MRHPLWNKVDLIEQKIQRIKNFPIRKDLTKMLKNATDELTQADKESVECRRRNQITCKFTEASDRADEYLLKIDKYLSVYLLMD